MLKTKEGDRERHVDLKKAEMFDYFPPFPLWNAIKYTNEKLCACLNMHGCIHA